jgi:hypothetical protein
MSPSVRLSSFVRFLLTLFPSIIIIIMIIGLLLAYMLAIACIYMHAQYINMYF